MSVTIPTKDVGEVQDCFRNINYQWTLEEGCEDYIKKELGVNG